MTKHGVVLGLVAAVSVMAVGCGAAPQGDEGQAASDALTVGVPNMWVCDLVAGTNKWPHVQPVAVDKYTQVPPSYGTYAYDFYQAITATVGYAPQNFTSISGEIKWLTIDIGNMSSTVQSNLTALVNTPYWQVSGKQVYPAIYSCGYDVTDCEDMGYTPQQCTAVKTVHTILAYDPGCVKASCGI